MNDASQVDKRAAVHIGAMLLHIQVLQGYLPKEQSQVGSELFQIKRLILTLMEKYSIEESDNREK